MKKLYFSSLRLAFALVCVGVSLILGSQWLGLVPDAHALRLQGRAVQCEAIAVSSAAMIRSHNWQELEAALTTIVNHDDDLLSIGVRADSGLLRLGTPGHDHFWPGMSQPSSTVDALHVPVTVNRRPWGAVELCYRSLRPTAWSAFAHHPITKLVGFFAVAGLLVYTFFISRVLRLFDATQVVPDRVRHALDTLAEGLLVLDEKATIVLANSAFAETVGIAAEELAGRVVSDLPWVPSEDATPLDYPWERAVVQMLPQTDQMMRYQLSDGSHRIFSINSAPIGTADGGHRGSLVTFRDVTHIEEHRAELETMLAMLQISRDEIGRKNRELQILATQDALTGCLNRRAFFERFERAWAAAKEANKPLACVMIDNDHFKNVNDTYGHHVGDEVLRKVAAILRSLHRADELVCRYGGEEFCVVLPGCDLRDAERQAERIRKAIQSVEFDSPKELRLTASLGVSDLTCNAPDPQELINQADKCLYVAKRQGRNRVVVFQSQFDSIQADGSAAGDRRGEQPAAEPPSTLPFQAVAALVSALTYRDAETAEHSRRVADLCVLAAPGLLNQRQTYILEIAALLHDIGKIGVPDDVLLKPGPLTAEEWKLMGQHDRIGAEIVADTFGCPELTDIMRNHHAFYGGNGRNPHLPQGQDIPTGARLLTIADSYDAMTSDRVYRRGRSHAEAVEELRRCAGTQFDPELVERFVESLAHYRRPEGTSLPSVTKGTALQIGLQIERLAEAVDNRDTEGLQTLASRLCLTARHNGVDSIAEAAERLDALAGDASTEWVQLLGLTGQLLSLCRATQNALLPETHRTLRPRLTSLTSKQPEIS